MAIFFISLRLFMPFPKIELTMLLSDNGLTNLRFFFHRKALSPFCTAPESRPVRTNMHLPIVGTNCLWYHGEQLFSFHSTSTDTVYEL